MSWPFGTGGLTTDNHKKTGGGGFFFQGGATTVSGEDGSHHESQSDYYKHKGRIACYSGSLVNYGKVYNNLGDMEEDEARASITGFMGL